MRKMRSSSLYIQSVSSKTTTKPYKVEVLVNRQMLVMEVDTGAAG